MSGSAAVKYLLSNDSDLQVDDLDIYVDDKFAEDLVEFFEEHGFRFSRKKHQTGRASDVLANARQRDLLHQLQSDYFGLCILEVLNYVSTESEAIIQIMICTAPVLKVILGFHSCWSISL